MSGRTRAPLAADRAPLEEHLAALWADLLGVPRVDPQDDLLALGAHSLLAARVLERVRRGLGVEISLAELFAARTVASFAGLVRAAQAGMAARLPTLPTLLSPPALGPAPRPDVRQVKRRRADTAAERMTRADAVPDRERRGGTPLSFAQERLWLIDQLHGGTAYNLPLRVDLAGPLSLPALRRALAEIERRHETLRTTFASALGEPFQVVGPPRRPALPQVDLGGLPAAMRDGELQRIAAGAAARPFDLERGPLWRALLLSPTAERHTLAAIFHHIVADGWSLAVLLRELVALYGAFAAGRGSPLAPLPVQYAWHAARQRQGLTVETVAAELSWWRHRLAGLAPLQLPADRPARESGARCATVETALPAAGRFAGLCQAAGTTPFSGLAAIFAALLGRVSGSLDIAFGTPVAQREEEEVEGLIGFLVNTLVLRIDLGGAPDLPALLARAHAAICNDFAHRRLPFERLVAELRPERRLHRNPLFEVAFSHNRPLPVRRAGGVAFTLVRQTSPEAKFDLHLEIVGEGSELTACWDYSTARFDRATVRRLAEHFGALLAAAAAAPERRLSELPLLGAAERQQVVVEWNEAAPGPDAAPSDWRRDEPAWTPLGERFARQAARRPDAVAVTAAEASLTYGEFDRRAAALARRLRRLGRLGVGAGGAESVVGVAMERGLAMIVALVGIARAGGVYLPLDPSHPPERLRFMLADAGARVLLVDRSAGGLEAISIGDAPIAGGAGSAGWARQAESLVYVTYTSGSTGQPKGVAVPERAVVRLVEASNYVSLGPSDVVVQAANASFDAATFEIWGALLNGARLLILPREVTLAPELLARRLREGGATVLFLTTALVHWLASAAPGGLGSLRQLLFGGEAVDPSRIAELLAGGGPARLTHVYGPTENTTFSSYAPVLEVPAGAATLPIGLPIRGSELHLLDAGLAPVPIGVTGEIYLGGLGLARGYLGQPALTAERFVPSPLGLCPGGALGARLYRTGDLGRRRADGAVEFLGRVDGQVKIRGFRIEPAEVEAALGSHPAVAECVVVARRRGGSTDELALAAYVVPRRTAACGPGTLREHLAGRLPDYMVPAWFVELPRLPRNANGKLDRAALPAPSEPADGRQDRTPPRSPVEELLAGTWADLLGREQVGRDDDFFALGGHSLLVTRLLARVRALLGVELPPDALFAEPTVAALAAEVARAQASGAPPLPPLVPLGDLAPARAGDGLATWPVSLAQRRLWFLQQLAGRASFLNVPWALALDGPLAAGDLARSLARIVARHEPLRSRFALAAGEPVQQVARAAALPLPVVDLAALGAERRQAAALALAAGLAELPFDLGRSPLARAVLLRRGAADHLLVFVAHHLVFDGASIGVLFGELERLYGASPARSTGEGNEAGGAALPAISYADFSLWQCRTLAGGHLAGALAWWRARLAGLPALDLPGDRPRGAAPGFRGGFREARLAPPGMAALGALCRRQGLTPFMALLAVAELLLGRLTGRLDFGIGAPVTGRHAPEVEPLIGFFVNTLVLRADLAGAPSCAALLARARRQALDAFAHQELPFAVLVEALNPARQAAQNPLFSVALSLEDEPPPPRLRGLRARRVAVEEKVAHFDLTLIARPADGGLAVILNYRRDLFDGPTAERLLGGFMTLLAGAIAQPEAPAWELPALPEAVRHQLLREHPAVLAPAGGAAAGATRAPDTVDRLAERQARSRPDALALAGGGVHLSHGELHRRAGRLADRLRRAGVRAESRVALCLPRSPELVVAALAVLRAGGAYMPLDPATPAARLTALLTDAGAPLLLTGRLELVALHDPAPEPATSAAPGAGGHGSRAASPSQLAYVIYTSGSTGRPKGVEVPHGGLTTLVAWHLDRYRITAADRASLVANPGFDAAVWELWPYLAAGASLHVPPSAVAASPRELLAWMAAEAITVAFLPTPLAEAVLLLPPPPGLALRLLLTGGDRLRQRPAGDAAFRLVNHYGPTESSVVATAAEVPAAELPAAAATRAAPPIGRPIAGTAVYLLDRLAAAPALAPPAAVGELAIAGAGLARGYLGRPRATAERFLPDPWSGEPGARLYRTGDLARWRTDGQLEFLGRADQQVQVRGCRVELGEVETTLASHPAVEAAAVVALPDATGALQLLGCFVPRHDTPAPDAVELRLWLRGRLPEPMVPASLAPIVALPLSARGKVDRAALAALVPRPAAPRGAPPRGELETAVGGAWCEVLGLPAVGADDNFFDLGGHSLALIAVQEKLLSRWAIELPLLDLFENPTVRSLAMRLGERLRPAPPSAAPTPLTPMTSMTRMPPDLALRAERQRTAPAWKERARRARRSLSGGEGQP